VALHRSALRSAHDGAERCGHGRASARWLAAQSVPPADWMRASAMPTLWPVEGEVTGSFGERIDPFNGKALSTRRGYFGGSGRTRDAPADGEVAFAGLMGGYGRAVRWNTATGVSTRYGQSCRICRHGGTARSPRRCGRAHVGLSGRKHRTPPPLRSSHWQYPVIPTHTCA